MTDVGFQRTDRTKALFGSELVEGMSECLDLYRVSQFGRRPMCLDILKVARIDVMSSIDGFLQSALRLKTGNGYSRCLTVLIGSTGLYQSIDMVPIALGILQSFQNDDANAISYHNAVGGTIEG